MNIWLDILMHIGNALGELLINPFYYISMLVIVLIYRRQIIVERKMFHTRLQGLGRLTWRNLVGGMIAGLAISVLFIFIGITLSIEAILCIWAVSFILMLFQIRFASFIYSVSVLGIIQFILTLIPLPETSGIINLIEVTIMELDIPALLCLAGLLHIAESLLIKWQSLSLAGPIYIEGKRGRRIGGYQMHHYWVIPLILLVPGTVSDLTLPWMPLYAGATGSEGYVFMGLPVMIGFTQVVMGSLVEHKAMTSFRRVLGYGAMLIVLSLVSLWWTPFMIVASLCGIGLLEFIIWYGKYEERQQSPIYLHPTKGLKILAVQPDSPADQLGILPGETLLKINSILLTTQEDMHTALRVNPAFCKLEVLNYSGESKFLQRAIYDGDHHQLGMILVPDETVQEALASSNLSLSIGQLLRPKLGVQVKQNRHNFDNETYSEEVNKTL